MIPYDAQHISALHRKVFSGKKHDTSSFSNALQFALGIFEQQKTQRKPDRVPAESPGHTMIFNKPLLIVFGGNNGQQVNVGCILKHLKPLKIYRSSHFKCLNAMVSIFVSIFVSCVPFESLFHGNICCNVKDLFKA